MTSYPTPRTASAVALTQTVLGQQSTVALPTPFIKLLGDCTAAVFLAQCCFLSSQSTDPEGWFERSHEVWRAELGLSPDQIRRCVRDCAGMVEVKRMGLPSRNFYRVLPEGITGRLGQLSPASSDTPSTPQSGAATSQRSTHQSATGPRSLQPAVVAPAPPQADEQTPRHSSSLEVKKKKEKNAAPVRGKDDVQPLPSFSNETLSRLLGLWNTHRGTLPEATGLNTSRRKALTVLLADCDGDVQRATQLLTDATREVAADKFWQDKKFGVDTLLPRVLGKAETYRSRQAKGPSISPAAAVPLHEFGVGQFVLYRRLRYAIEEITDRYIDLWDEENGSARILIHTDDIRSVRPLEVRE